MRRVAQFLLAALCLAAAAPAVAEYPDRAVRIVLPYAAGGGADALTRILAQKLTARTGQSVIVDNRPGAGATIGTDIVAKSAPDGYTLLMTAGTIAVSPSAYPKLPYNVVKDFVPITTVAQSPFVLVLRRDLGIESLPQLLARARAEPGKLNFGSAGNGTMAHLSVELLKTSAGIDVTHVPYKGSNPALNDLLGGQVDAVFDTPAAVMPHVKAEKLKALAVTTSKRTASAPGVPTMIEAGLPGYDVSVWFGLMAPAGTSPHILQKIHADTAASLASPDVVERLDALGLEVTTMEPDAFAALLRADLAKWAEVIKKAGISFE